MPSVGGGVHARGMAKAQKKRILTIAEFAEIVGVHRRTVDYWRARFQRPLTVRLPGGRLAVPVSEVEAALDGTMHEEISASKRRAS